MLIVNTISIVRMQIKIMIITTVIIIFTNPFMPIYLRDLRRICDHI